MATVADLIGIKEQIQTILQAANTTTASPIDLSQGLVANRVQQILKIHPEMIRPQASFFPLVTCFVTEKTPTGDDIAVNQLQSTRRATVNISVLGSIWNSNIVSTDEDPADEDINRLMENIELSLRGNPTFNGKVKWHRPAGCQYYITLLNEKTHLRSGILNYQAEIFY